jgi:hypothetical protein
MPSKQDILLLPSLMKGKATIHSKDQKIIRQEDNNRYFFDVYPIHLLKRMPEGETKSENAVVLIKS